MIINITTDCHLWVMAWRSFGELRIVDIWLPRDVAYRAAVARCMRRDIVAALAAVTLAVTLSGCSMLTDFDAYTFDERDAEAWSDASTVAEDAGDAADVDPPIDAGHDAAIDAGGDASHAPDASALLDAGADSGECCGVGCAGCQFHWCPLLGGDGTQWTCSISGISCEACP